MAFIYFTYDLELNGIKVGMTMNKVASRITEELELIGSVAVNSVDRDPRRLETAIHYCLRDHAIVGERFYPDRRVVDFVCLALSEGIERALLQHGDDAFVEIGFRRGYHKKMGRTQLRASIRDGHPTRLYASDAWSGAQLSRNWKVEGPKRNFLRLCPLREFRQYNARLLAMKPKNSISILVEEGGGSELVEVVSA